MDYFFSKLGRGFRYTTTVIGTLCCGTIIILGALGINTIVIPICGGFLLIPLGMVLVENVKFIKDMENLVSKFKIDVKNLGKTNELLTTNVDNLGSEIIDLKSTKDLLIDQTDKLTYMLKNAEGEIEKLAELATNYKENIGKLNENLKETEINNDKLKENTNKLLSIKSEYETENNKLKINVNNITQQIKEIKLAKEDYENQLDDLKHNNTDLNKTSELLKTELDNVNSCYEEAKDVIETLLRSKNVLNDIYDGMTKTEEKTEENVGMMSKLLNMFGVQRSKELFEVLDKDGNKFLTSDEFIDGMVEQSE